MLTACAFNCLTNIVSATHKSSVRIIDRISSFEQLFLFSFQFFIRLDSVFVEEIGGFSLVLDDGPIRSQLLMPY